MKKPLERATVDPVSRIISRNLKAKLDELGWSIRYLAKQVGCDQSNLTRYLAMRRSNRSGYAKWDIPLLLQICKLLGTTIEVLAEVSQPEPGRMFNPWYDDPKGLLDAFAEHEHPASLFITFDRLFACPRMTPDVQTRVHLSLYAPLLGTEAGVTVFESSEKWGNTRRERYLAKGLVDIPRTITIMLRSEFKLLVDLQPPYNLCRPEHAINSIYHLKQRCVSERGFRLMLVDDGRLARHHDLKLMLEPLLAVGVLGEHFAYEKFSDHRVVWYERVEEVSRCRKLLQRLGQLVSYDVEEEDVVRELDTYLSQLEGKRAGLQKEIDARHEELVKNTEAALRFSGLLGK